MDDMRYGGSTTQAPEVDPSQVITPVQSTCKQVCEKIIAELQNRKPTFLDINAIALHDAGLKAILDHCRACSLTDVESLAAAVVYLADALEYYKEKAFRNLQYAPPMQTQAQQRWRCSDCGAWQGRPHSEGCTVLAGKRNIANPADFFPDGVPAGRLISLPAGVQISRACADCGGPIGEDGGPPGGWQLDDGRTVCQACCVTDLKGIAAALRNSNE